MCIGALGPRKNRKTYIRCQRAKVGSFISAVNDILGKNSFNHRFKVLEGVLEDECSQLMRSFFRARRNN